MTTDNFPCPQCQAPTVANARFCASCGTPLATLEPHAGPDMPKAEAAKQPHPVKPVGFAAARAMWQSASGRTQALIGAGLALAGLIAIAVMLATAGSSTSHAAADNDASVVDELASLRRCEQLWNSDGNDQNRQMVQTTARYDGSSYVDVDYDADFPDKCLVTLAFSDYDRSMQFIERGVDRDLGPFKVADMGAASTLPQSSKGWNAQLNAEDGTIALDG
jgi:zinc-ribbon domain